MIGHIPHPTKPGKVLSVALYMKRSPTWIPLAEPFDDDFSAAQACADRLAVCFNTIVHHARIMRVLCEHPAFEFVSEGVDADSVRAQAVLVDELIQAQVPNVRLLLQGPVIEDVVRMGGVRMQVQAGGLLAACPENAEPVLSDDVEAQLHGFVAALRNVIQGLPGNGQRMEAYEYVLQMLFEASLRGPNAASVSDADAPRGSEPGEREPATDEHPATSAPAPGSENRSPDDERE